MSINQLWQDPEDFRKSLDAGIKLITEAGPLSVDPADEDKSTLKSLLAAYMTGVFDPEKLKDPELAQKTLVVRMTMLAAYNLGTRTRQVRSKNTWSRSSIG